jgi:hypothetical protein
LNFRDFPLSIVTETPIRLLKVRILLNITSEFNEVYFSERRNFEATHKIPTSKNKFGGAGENREVLGEADPANR